MPVCDVIDRSESLHADTAKKIRSSRLFQVLPLTATVSDGHRLRWPPSPTAAVSDGQRLQQPTTLNSLQSTVCRQFFAVNCLLSIICRRLFAVD